MSKNRFDVRDIVIVGMLSALVIVSTLIKIPYGQEAQFHLGSAALFTFALLFGGVRAGLAGAIGSALYDLIFFFSPYTIWSFFIKGIAGLIIGLVAHSGQSNGQNTVKNIFACLAGAAWTLAGYLAAWTVIIGSFKAALLNAPSSLISSAAGIIIAIPFSAALRLALKRTGLLR